jgi:hypothetical protein
MIHFNNPLVITIKQKSEYRFYLVAILLLYILQKWNHKIVAYFSNTCYHPQYLSPCIVWH